MLTFVCIYIFTTGELSTKSSIMAPRKASKATAETLGQGLDTVSDTSPQSIDTVKTWSYVSPPRILDSIATNLSSVVDWYVEAKFSYIRVFGASVPPYALPLFMPNRLVYREIARQIVIGGISKELKGFSKKVWPPFPIHLNTYSLLDFRHAKAEATTLEDIKLVHIEFKKHESHKVMGNHMASCGLKRNEHEHSPHDDIFRGARSYDEVLNRIQTLSPEEMADFFKFQGHR
jgi:hypothetical protein